MSQPGYSQLVAGNIQCEYKAAGLHPTQASFCTSTVVP
jgi:hypothetical protein